MPRWTALPTLLTNPRTYSFSNGRLVTASPRSLCCQRVVQPAARYPVGRIVTPYLFVYGTLRSASPHTMSGVLAKRATLVGEATAQGLLFDLGSYPGAVHVVGSRSRIRGELYRLRSPYALTILDAYERCGRGNPQPHLFRRQTTEVRLVGSGDSLRAWIYWYRGSIDGAAPIPSGEYLGV